METRATNFLITNKTFVYRSGSQTKGHGRDPFEGSPNFESENKLALISSKKPQILRLCL